MKDTEIEIKVKVESSAALIKFLKKNGKFLHKHHQVDEYYTPAHKNFLDSKPTNEWLRLRSSNRKYSINYKNWYRNPDGTADHCDELETTVGDIDQLRKIFQAQNIKHLVTVDKVRKSWTYKDFEISLDKVKNLGDFVEIEFKGKGQKVNPQKIATEMMEFLKKIGVGKMERDLVGYPYLLLEKLGEI